MINGVVTVLITPLNKDGTISVESLEKLINYQINNGVGAFWALGSTGEEINLSRKVRLEYVEILSSLVKKRVPVIMGTGELSIKENLNFYHHCLKNEIDFVSYIHRDTKQGAEEYCECVRKIESKSPLPIFLYNNVQRGKEIDYQSVSKLATLPNIVGVKYGARNHMPFIQASSLNSKNFQVFSAGNFFFSAMCYGCKASTTSDANFLPNVYKKIKYLFDEGDIVASRNLQYLVINLLSELPRTKNGESSAEIKYILSQMGICTEYVNDSYRTLNNEEKKQVDNLLPKILSLDEECKISN